MTKSRLRLVIGISALLITLIGGGIVYMVYQHQVKEEQEHQKMVAIATSEEARKVYRLGIEYENPNALENGLIKDYEIDKNSLEYNPMGGLMVKVIFNGDNELSIGYNLIDNGDGTYHSAYYTYSPALVSYLEEE